MSKSDSGCDRPTREGTQKFPSHQRIERPSIGVGGILDLAGIGRFEISAGSDPWVRRVGSDPWLPASMVHLGVPCFTPGARIDTPSGPRPVENLLPGDRIVTRDSGTNIILWIGRKTLSWSDLRRNRHLAPVLLRAGSLGDDVPARDILVSPNHRILAETERSTLFHADPEVLVPAKHLVDNRNILEVDALGVTYHHFLFDRHEVVHSDGVWSESFQPADYTLSAVGNAQRAEILELFPDLRAPEGMVRFEDARRTLRWPDMRRWRD